MLDNFVLGTKVVTTFLYDDFGALTNETVVGVAGTNVIERLYDSLGRALGYAAEVFPDLSGIERAVLLKK